MSDEREHDETCRKAAEFGWHAPLTPPKAPPPPPCDCLRRALRALRLRAGAP